MDRGQPISPLLPGQAPVPLLSQPVWLQLSHEMRNKLVRLFGIKRSGATETYMGRDSVVRVVSDGYTAADLMTVTTLRMQELLGTDSTDFYALFDDVIGNIDALLDGTFLNPIDSEIVEEIELRGEGFVDEKGEPHTTKVEVVGTKNRRGRPAKQ